MKVETRVDGSNSAYASTNMKHSKDIDPSIVACALQRASKNQLLECWGLSTEEPICKAGKKCF